MIGSEKHLVRLWLNKMCLELRHGHSDTVLCADYKRLYNIQNIFI